MEEMSRSRNHRERIMGKEPDVGIMEEESWRRNHGVAILEGESLRRSQGRELLEEKSYGRNHGGRSRIITSVVIQKQINCSAHSILQKMRGGSR